MILEKFCRQSPKPEWSVGGNGHTIRGMRRDTDEEGTQAGAAGTEGNMVDGLVLTGEGATLSPSRRIFVNRNLRFDRIRQIGFDMDYTLAPYVKRNIEELSFQMTKEKMVRNLGYPDEILALPYDASFVVRGLVVDKRLGNIFKMDGHQHIGAVYHGRNQLTKDQRRRHYRNVKIRLSAARYHWIDTLFALPEAVLYADIIHHFDASLKTKGITYRKLFDDIRASIDECHRDGSLKTVVKADLAQYISVDQELPKTLHKLRSSGKKLFVLTNSFWDYTNAVMSFLLDGKLREYPRWQNFFDLVIVGAQKPTFFTGNNPFYAIEPHSGKVAETATEQFVHRGVYQGGSLKRFEALVNEGGEHLMYVGDHIYGDIIRSKKDSLWRTALILEELEHEIACAQKVHKFKSELLGLEEQRALLDHEITVLKLKLSRNEATTHLELPDILEGKRHALREIVARRISLSEKVAQHYNPYWGSVFKEGPEVSRFGEQVENFACVYTSRVSNFLYYSPSQYFRAPRHWMSHEKIYTSPASK